MTMNGLIASTWLSLTLASAPATPAGDVALPENLVVSGAVSLGAYQAGFLYYYMTWMAEQADPSVNAPLRVVSGASAGSLNGLLAAVTACSKPMREAPEASLFYGWVEVGMTGKDGLASGEVTSRSFLSRAPVVKAIDAIRIRLETGTDWQKCDILFGATVTHVDGRELLLPGSNGKGDRTFARVQADRFVFRIRSDGENRPTITTYPAPSYALASYYPVLGKTATSRKITFEELSKVLLASSAVPLAFAPVTLEYTIGETTSVAEFIDGGAFDNTPLLLAQRMNQWSGGARDARFLFVDPTMTTWQRPRYEPPSPKNRGEERKQKREVRRKQAVLGTYAGFVASALGSSRQAALVAPVEQDPELATLRLDAPARNLAVMSDQLFDMLGFFERDFRIFDFYLGMATARRYLESQIPGQRDALTKFRRSIAERSPKFGCVNEFVDRIDGSTGTHPLSVDVSSIDECTRLDAGEAHMLTGKQAAEYDRRRERPLANHNLTSLLSVSKDMRWYLETTSPDAPDASRNALTKLVKLLQAHEFQFVDLLTDTRGWFGRKLRSIDADEARALVRDTLEHQLAQLAYEQPFGRKTAVRVAAQTGLNVLAYRDPQYVLGVGAKRLSAEGTFGARLGIGRVRIDLLLRAGEILDIALPRRGDDEEDTGYTGEVSAALRTSIALLRKPIAQIEGGIAAGVWEVFRWQSGHVLVRPGIELGTTLIILQRVYVEAAHQVFLDGCDRDYGTATMHGWCRDLQPAHHKSFNIYRFVVSAGLRFLPSPRRSRKARAEDGP